MTTAHLFHGIRAFDAHDQMGELKDNLSSHGITTEIRDYGYILFPLTNGSGVEEADDNMRPGDDAVCYSNGAAVIHQAVHEGRVKPRRLVLISPALPVDAQWPEDIEAVLVMYSPGDFAVRFGSYWAAVANVLPWRWGTAREHPWGAMGLNGPSTDDPRVTSKKLPERVSHTWFKYPEVVQSITEQTVDFLN